MVGAQDWPNIRPLASETMSGSMRLRANGAFCGISSLWCCCLQRLQPGSNTPVCPRIGYPSRPLTRYRSGRAVERPRCSVVGAQTTFSGCFCAQKKKIRPKRGSNMRLRYFHREIKEATSSYDSGAQPWRVGNAWIGSYENPIFPTIRSSARRPRRRHALGASVLLSRRRIS